MWMTDCDATINLYDVSSSLQAFIRVKDGKNYARKIKQVGNKLNVAVEDNLLRIHRKVYADCENEDFTAMTSNILVNAEDSSFFYVIEKNAGYTGCKREKNQNNNTSAVRGIHVDVQNERIDYFKAKVIPGVKMTIVSATLNEELYKRFCKGREIHMLEVPAAEYRGRLIQYTTHSMSRSNMQEIGYDQIRKCVEDIVREPVKNVITFKMYTANAGIYYGKTEGYNEYKGKDLVVIGTPHNVPFVYRLIGAYLGYDAEDKLSVQFTENRYYSFKFMTFKDENMRNLQFYFIESELEQAIGRARLLRYDCSVYLFLNFPCRQANIIQDEYLPDNIF